MRSTWKFELIIVMTRLERRHPRAVFLQCTRWCCKLTHFLQQFRCFFDERLRIITLSSEQSNSRL